MMMQDLSRAFNIECHSIADLLENHREDIFSTVTLFKGWTIGDIMAHLHLWNIAADMTLNEPDKFQSFMMKMMSALVGGQSHIALQNAYFGKQSKAQIFAAWQSRCEDIAQTFAQADPEARVKWAGPDMSVKSCIIARQMEHWAHAQAIFDALGVERKNGPRLKNIAHLGVTTYSWSFKVNQIAPPLPKPYVRLNAPGGEIWEWNDKQLDNRVTGTAEQFCQVVTQCRNIADTEIKTIGDTARKWMEIAQCFAGGAETPPTKGSRHLYSEP
ncbi:TIGR03084 family metal-binding protein [Robiginitomaculum antarcticum]|uniref:TIGR03084 family metal-binding protein n=1 Tax=Robiginitomaculum antarcticum TaxID=437507 RepID=UPI000362060C|nr:TIGR03084 family metal-binding protein [Robiginitomaculum antarcticum]